MFYVFYTVLWGVPDPMEEECSPSNGNTMFIFLPQFGEEVHLESMRELCRGAEGEVHVLPQHLRDVGLGDLHPPRQLRLVDAHPLHPAQNPAKKRRSDMVNRTPGEKEKGEGRKEKVWKFSTLRDFQSLS